MRRFNTENISSTIHFLLYTVLLSISSFSYAHDNEYNNRPPGVSLTTLSKFRSTALHTCEQTLNSYPYWGLNYHCTEHREIENGIGYWQPHDCLQTYPYTCSSLGIYDGFPIEKKEGYESKDNAKDACELFLQNVYNNGGNGECLEKGDTESMYFAHDYDHDGEVRPGCKHWYRHDFNTPPDVTIKTPENGSTHFNNTDISFRGTAGDDDEGNLHFNIRWSVDGYTVTGNSFKRAFNAGNYTVTAKVTDARGVTATDSHTFTVKSHGISLGTINVTLGANHQAYMPVPISISSAKIDDLDSRTHVRWNIDGTDYGQKTSISPILIAGTHTVTATLSLHGNTESKSKQFVVAPSTPALTINSPEWGKIFDIKEAIVFNANVVFAGKESTHAVINWDSDLSGRIGNSKNFSIEGLEEGVHSITVRATENGESVERNFVITVYDAEKNMGDQNDGQCFGGNPINLMTGNKYNSEIDFSTNTEFPLYLKRSYNSTSQHVGIFGHGWSSNIEERVEHNSQAQQTSVISDTGAAQRFDFVGDQWVDNSSDFAKLVQLTDSTWRYTLYNGTVKTYNSAGQITKVTGLNNLSIDYFYSAGKLDRVEDDFGNVLDLDINKAGFVDRFTDADGYVFNYSYRNDNLTAIAYPDATPGVVTDNPTKHYVYENTSFPHALTGMIDEENVRFATWGYDGYGRAVHSEHAGDTEEFTISYNDNGSITTTNALGKKTTYWYESIKGILKVSGVSGHESTHCAATYASTEYDPETGFASEKTDWRGNKVLMTANKYGQIESTTIVDTGAGWTAPIDERVTVTTHYNTLRLPEKTIQTGLTVRKAYTPEGRIDSITSTDTTNHTIPYSTNGKTRVVDYEYTLYEGTDIVKTITIDGPRIDVTDITTLEYNLQGLLYKSTNALGHVIEYRDYNSRGLPKTVIDVNGLEIGFVYWPLGWVKTQTVKSSKGEAVTHYTYHNNGKLKSITSPDDSSLTYTYNDAGHLDYVTNSLGEKQDFEPSKFDGAWSSIQYLDAGGTQQFSQSRLFDELGRVRQSSNEQGNIVDYKYDGSGNITSSERLVEFGNVSDVKIDSYGYDVFNRVRVHAVASKHYPRSKSLAPTQSSTYYNYDTAGNLVEVKLEYKVRRRWWPWPRNQITGYIYNGFGELIQEHSLATGKTVYQRDRSGNIVNKINSENQISVLSYDELNRISTEKQTGASAEDRYFYYDVGLNGKGRLTAIVDQSGTQSWAFDDQGFIDMTNYAIDGSAYSIDYDYNKSGELIDIVYPSGQKVEYGYDLLGRPNQVNMSAGEDGGVALVSNITYKPFGPLTSYDYGSGLTRSVSYDKSYRTTSLTTGWLTEDEIVDYSYDSANRIRGLSRSLKNDDNQTIWDSKSFEYDLVGRLTAAQWTTVGGQKYRSDESLKYHYDSLGNRVTKRINSSSQPHFNSRSVYSVTPTNNQLKSVSESVNGEPWALASSYSYLNTGQAETRGQTAYTYNRSQRLTKVTESGIIKGTYQYNSSGQRVSKTANGITTHFHYNLAGQLLAETTDAGEVIRQYVYLGGMPVAMLTGNKAYDGVASTQQELVGETNLSVNAEGSTEKTSLMAVTGNQIISAKLTDMSEKTGKEFYGLTLREQVEGDKGAKINVYFSAKNTSSLNMITVKTPEGKIVPIPMFGRSTGAEALEIDIVYAGGSLAHEQFERSGDWVKLERNDQYVSVLTSVDGINWIMLREYNLPTVDDAYMGVVAMNTKAAFDIRYTAANDNLFYLHTDHLGSVVAVSSNSTKSKVWQRRDFDIGASPFGLDVLPNGEKLHDGLFEMPLRFPGQYYDQETGTNYNYFRDYDPSIGRYIQSDPIGLGGGLNTYGYVGGNPIQLVDRFGLTAECPTGPPMNDPNWIPYTGDPEVFHCGFNGYLESRQPTPDDPIGECFYDSCGALVDDKHEYALCGGTPDQYLFDPEESNRIKRFINGFNHSVRDTGGINHKGFGAFMESNKYREENYGGDE